MIKRYFNRSAIQALLAAGGLAAGIQAILWVIHRLADIPMEEFVLDPSEIMNAPFYFGFMSNIGVTLWGVGSALGIFSYIALGRAGRSTKKAHYMLALSLFTLLLLADDQLRIHETIFGHFLNIRERYVFAAYLVIILAISAIYLRTLLDSDLLILGFVVLFLASSTIVDQLELNFPGESLVEEGAKFIGIVLWLVYLGRLGLSLLGENRKV